MKTQVSLRYTSSEKNVVVSMTDKEIAKHVNREDRAEFLDGWEMRSHSNRSLKLTIAQ